MLTFESDQTTVYDCEYRTSLFRTLDCTVYSQAVSHFLFILAGKVLNIDLRQFYVQLYQSVIELDACKALAVYLLV